MGHPDLEKGKLLFQTEFEDQVIGMGKGDAGRHDGSGSPFAAQDPLEKILSLLGAEVLNFLVELLVKSQAVAGGRRPALGVFGKTGKRGGRGDRPEGDSLAGVADPGGRPDHDRDLEFLGDPEPFGDQVFRFLRSGGVQDRDLGHQGHEAAVLLGLGAVGPRVVCGNDQEPALDPGVSRAHERVAGHVQPHLFHADRGAAAGVADGQSRFEGHLFIDRPLGQGRALLRPGHLQERGKNFRGRGAGVGSGEDASAFQKPAGNGLISQKNFLHFFSVGMHRRERRGRRETNNQIQKTERSLSAISLVTRASSFDNKYLSLCSLRSPR